MLASCVTYLETSVTGGVINSADRTCCQKNGRHGGFEISGGKMPQEFSQRFTLQVQVTGHGPIKATQRYARLRLSMVRSTLELV